MASFLLIQGIGFIAVVLSIAVFQVNKRNRMLVLNIAASLLYTLHFFLLGATTGAAMNFLNAIRYLVFRKVKPSKQNSWILYIFVLAAGAATTLTWQGLFSLLAMVGTILSTIAYWPAKPRTIRRIALTVPPFWFSYNAVAGSFAGMFVEVFLLVSNLIGQYRFDYKQRGIIQKSAKRKKPKTITSPALN